MAKIRKHEISKYWELWSSKICEIFCGILISQNIMCSRKYCESISWNYFLGRLLLNFKILFELLEISCCKSILGWDLMERFYTASKPCANWKRLFLLIKFIFLKPKPSFSWSKVLYTVYLRKIVKIFFDHRFSQKSVSFNWEKKNRVFVCEVESFQYWHTRTSLYLTIASVEKHCSKVFSFISLLSWVVVRIGNLDVL